jgi:hypothetical protein
LTVECRNVDSIGGFLGNDFYGSGYDNDFYRSAINLVPEAHPDYIAAMSISEHL